MAAGTPAATAAAVEDWSDVEKYNILNCAGVDKMSRPVMVFSASNMPPREDMDHDKLLRYMRSRFDQIVESDYSIIYFHHGLGSKARGIHPLFALFACSIPLQQLES